VEMQARVIYRHYIQKTVKDTIVRSH